MKVIAFTRYNDTGSSSRYRYYNYLNCFNTSNIKLIVLPFFSVEYLSKKNIFNKVALVLVAYFKRFILVLSLIVYPRRCKCLIIEYELFPYFSSIFERLLKLRKIPYIVDYDDAIFHRYDQHSNLVLRFLLKNKIPKVMKHASAVIVGNDYLQAYARNHNAKILQLPTVVLLDKYEEAIKKHNKRATDSPFVIGWIGSKTTSSYVLDILPAIEEFVSEHDACCRFIGFDEDLLSDQIKQKCKITIIPWSEKTEIQEMLNFDVGIMPLRNDAWSRGKCGFKLIQYMSCKKPVIASPVGVNKDIVEDGVHGFLADTKREWLLAFKKIYQDESLRTRMSENNWHKICSEFNHADNCKKYIDFIKNIVGSVK